MKRRRISKEELHEKMLNDYKTQNIKYSNLLKEISLGGAVPIKDNVNAKHKLGNLGYRSDIPKEHKQSKGEQLIELILIDKKVKYLKEVKFKGCKNPLTQKQLRFDFFIPHIPACIEFDGEQHFMIVEEFDGVNGEVNLRKRQILDNIKSKFCRKNKIRLLRIAYDRTKYADKWINKLLN